MFGISEQLEHADVQEMKKEDLWIERLLRYYKPWYEKYDYSPKMTIDGDKLDFIASEEDRQEVLNQIVAKLKEMSKLDDNWKPNLVK